MAGRTAKATGPSNQRPEAETRLVTGGVRRHLWPTPDLCRLGGARRAESDTGKPLGPGPVARDPDLGDAEDTSRAGRRFTYPCRQAMKAKDRRHSRPWRCIAAFSANARPTAAPGDFGRVLPGATTVGSIGRQSQQPHATVSSKPAVPWGRTHVPTAYGGTMGAFDSVPSKVPLNGLRPVPSRTR